MDKNIVDAARWFVALVLVGFCLVAAGEISGLFGFIAKSSIALLMLSAAIICGKCLRKIKIKESSID